MRIRAKLDQGEAGWEEGGDGARHAEKLDLADPETLLMHKEESARRHYCHLIALLDSLAPPETRTAAGEDENADRRRNMIPEACKSLDTTSRAVKGGTPE